MQLVRVYVAALGSGSDVDDDVRLQEGLAAICERARRAVPSVEPVLADFVRRLASCSRDRVPPALERAEDLALASAAGRGDTEALQALDALLVASVRRAVARIDRSPAFADLVAQELRTRLFVGPRPRIADYAAGGPLSSWLRSAAARIALNLRRGRA